MRNKPFLCGLKREHFLRSDDSNGLVLVFASLLSTVLSSTAMASGRHSAPPQCLPTSASTIAPVQTFTTQLASYSPPPPMQLASKPMPASAQSDASSRSSSGSPLAPMTAVPTSESFLGGGWTSSGGSSSPLCYLKGTHILTERGEIEIEQLLIGDMILTHSGEYKPLKWVGQSCYRKVMGAEWQLNVMPVCITRSAIGENIPTRDLYVSPAHALYLEGSLINALRLINGRTIYQAMPEETDIIEYFQLEFEEHEVVYAEGALAESFQARRQREFFSNFNEFERLYGKDDRMMDPYAPRFNRLRYRDVIFAEAREALSIFGLAATDPVQVARTKLAARASRCLSEPLGV